MLAAFAVTLPGGVACQEPADGNRGASIRLVRELAIGSDRSGPEYEFSGVGGVAAARSGSAYVAAYNGTALQVRKYDALGRYCGVFGRVGAGPGEYRRADGMAIVGDTVLVLYDRANGRVTLFDTSGAYRSSFRVSAGSFFYNYFAVLADGSVAVRARARPSGPGGELVGSVFVRYRLDGAEVDSITVPAEETGGIVLADPSVGLRWPFSVTTIFAVLPDGGIATAHTSRYRIEVAPAGDRSFAIERSVSPIPLEGSEREEWEASVRRGHPRSEIVIPTRKPFMRRLLADAEGRIWVEIYTQATRYPRSTDPAIAQRQTLTWEEPNTYDVFDRRGTYLGRVGLAPFSRMVAVLGNRIWVVEKADDGFRVLVRYRMTFRAE